jgi:hypothetical protein
MRGRHNFVVPTPMPARRAAAGHEGASGDCPQSAGRDARGAITGPRTLPAPRFLSHSSLSSPPTDADRTRATATRYCQSKKSPGLAVHRTPPLLAAPSNIARIAHWSPALPSYQFQVLFDSLFKVLFIFRSHYVVRYRSPVSI